MNTERGSAIAMVMLVLAVVSLLGVALLTQSRMDMQLTSSLEVYDDITNRADGAATLELTRLRRAWRTDIDSLTCCGTTTAQVTTIGDSTVGSRDLAATDRSRFIHSYNIDPPAGFQKGAAPAGYKEVNYGVTGRAWRKFALGVRKSDTSHDVPESSVTVYVSVVSKKE